MVTLSNDRSTDHPSDAQAGPTGTRLSAARPTARRGGVRPRRDGRGRGARVGDATRACLGCGVGRCRAGGRPARRRAAYRRGAGHGGRERTGGRHLGGGRGTRAGAARAAAAPGATTASVRVGPLPHLREVAAFAARRPAHVVLLADRDDAAVIAHAAGERQPAQRFAFSAGPGAQLAGRVAQAAASVAAHIVLGVGDQHVLDAVAGHLPASLGPVTTIASGPLSTDSDDQFSARIGTALDGIAAGAISAVGDLVASSAAAPVPVAVRGIEAVAGQLAGAGRRAAPSVRHRARNGDDNGDAASCRIGQRPTELPRRQLRQWDPGAAGGWAGLGRAASGRDRRPAPYLSACSPASQWPRCCVAGRPR